MKTVGEVHVVITVTIWLR